MKEGSNSWTLQAKIDITVRRMISLAYSLIDDESSQEQYVFPALSFFVLKFRGPFPGNYAITHVMADGPL
jgi:hypothetical protein